MRKRFVFVARNSDGKLLFRLKNFVCLVSPDGRPSFRKKIAIRYLSKGAYAGFVNTLWCDNVLYLLVCHEKMVAVTFTFQPGDKISWAREPYCPPDFYLNDVEPDDDDYLEEFRRYRENSVP